MPDYFTFGDDDGSPLPPHEPPPESRLARILTIVVASALIGTVIAVVWWMAGP